MFREDPIPLDYQSLTGFDNSPLEIMRKRIGNGFIV